MPQDAFDLSIVIPAFRESEKICTDIHAATKFLRDRGLSGEVIIVDDGSPDDTSDRARSLLSTYDNLRVFRYDVNRGKGHALRFGVDKAQGRNLLFADSGLCVPFEIATLGLSMLDLRMCDIAHGSRRMRGSVRRAQPLYRRLGSKAFKLFIHSCMGIPSYISDTQCGFKLYRTEVAKTLYAEAFTDGFMFDTEIILRALRYKYRILEFPVLWSNDSDTRYDPVRGTLRNLVELTKIRVGLLRNTKPSLLTAQTRLE